MSGERPFKFSRDETTLDCLRLFSGDIEGWANTWLSDEGPRHPSMRVLQAWAHVMADAAWMLEQRGVVGLVTEGSLQPATDTPGGGS